MTIAFYYTTIVSAIPFHFSDGYSFSEVEAGVHAGIVGLDVGVDPVEIVDLLGGIVGIDIRNDDL
jgi:hypothetical protein